MTRTEAEQLIREGVDALRRGASAQARERFEAAIAADSGADDPSFLLAQACRHQGDRPAEIAALERALAAQQDNVAACLMMGEAKSAIADDRAATSFFTRALGYAAQQPNLPVSLHPLLERAQAWLQDAQRKFADHLVQHLAAQGIDRSRPSRVGAAVSLLLGEAQIYVQQPTIFYLPGLPQRQFYEREEFDWIAEVETLVPDMQEELGALLAQDQVFDPYITTTADRPRSVNPLADDNKWGAWYFWENGKRVVAHAEQCPKTMAALDLAPIPVIQNRSPMALYSVLEPDTHIIPHHGALNTRLICHIPLIVPPGCALRCGNETRAWQEGKALIFDDSIEHEAWNRGSERRTILLFDIWRPEITLAEREQLAVIFEAVDDYGLGDINA